MIEDLQKSKKGSMEMVQSLVIFCSHVVIDRVTTMNIHNVK